MRLGQHTQHNICCESLVCATGSAHTTQHLLRVPGLCDWVSTHYTTFVTSPWFVRLGQHTLHIICYESLVCATGSAHTTQHLLRVPGLCDWVSTHYTSFVTSPWFVRLGQHTLHNICCESLVCATGSAHTTHHLLRVPGLCDWVSTHYTTFVASPWFVRVGQHTLHNICCESRVCATGSAHTTQHLLRVPGLCDWVSTHYTSFVTSPWFVRLGQHTLHNICYESLVCATGSAHTTHHLLRVPGLCDWVSTHYTTFVVSPWFVRLGQHTLHNICIC